MIIYKVTNQLNGKMYIGQTIVGLVNRKNAHKQDWKLGRKSKYRLYQAFDKYGFENFQWEILDTATSNKELNEKEQFWISKLDTYSSGYNMTTGGDYNPNVGKFGELHHNAKSYLITHPTGEVEQITGLRAWCREHGLNHQGITAVATGKWPHYKGYTASYLL